MFTPYLLMVLFFLSMGFLGALGAGLTSAGWMAWFNGLPWLRVHFITVGVLLELAFGALPFLARAHDGEAPRMRWDIWLALNAGLLLLLIGIPLVNPSLLISGGALIFAAATLLLLQLGQGWGLTFGRLIIRSGRNFYMAALLYLLLGVFLGSGLWLGWGQSLGIANPKEVHVHSNLWGFTALLFAGLLVDLHPRIGQRPAVWTHSTTAIFWAMALGALGLVIGPWIQLNALTAAGLLLHTAGTLLLLVTVVRSRQQDWTAGHWHLVSAYVWFLLPVVVAPLIVANVDRLAVQNVEQSGAPILIYGWILPVTYALIPYLVTRLHDPDRPAPLGGNRLSLSTIHAGGIAYALSLFLGVQTGLLQALAFSLWAVSMLPALRNLWQLLARRAARQPAARTLI
ncbi:MAG TPA: hypothetical protein VK879_10080 [Candidatus Sulfomarinibacteraceae bacterium]|nr:hypothetical protein [Candidatus Sulfomarinibacteraceae bacterium]